VTDKHLRTFFNSDFCVVGRLPAHRAKLIAMVSLARRVLEVMMFRVDERVNYEKGQVT
jgi:hypothetical protein